MRTVLFWGKLLFVGIRQCLHSSSLKQINLKLQQNVKWMARKRVHGSQFSQLNQPSVKKKKEITNENVKKKIDASNVRVELKTLLSEEKIVPA